MVRVHATPLVKKMESTSVLATVEFMCKSVTVPIKFALLPPSMVRLLQEICSDRFDPSLLYTLSPSVITQLSGIEMDILFPPVEGNPVHTNRFKLLEKWAADKSARKAQFETALYLNLCVCLNKKKMLPYGLRDLLVFRFDHNAKTCANWYFTNVYLRIEHSKTSKSVLLAILARNTMRYRSNTLDDNTICLGVKEKKVPSEVQDLLFFRLLWLLESFVCYLLRSHVISKKAHHGHIETGENVSRKQLLQRFVTWMDEECDNVPTEMFGVKYTDKGCFHKFVASLLCRMLTKDDTEDDPETHGFYILDKTKRAKN